MERPTRVDVVVAGASIAGLVAARGLAESGASVLVTGPAGPEDLGLCVLGLPEHPARIRAALGADRWHELLDLQRRAMAVLELDRCDQLWAAVLDNELDLVERSVEALVEAGLETERLDRAALAALGVHAERGFRVVDGAALLAPRPTIDRWQAAAEAAGARVVLAPVEWVDEDRDGLRVVVSDAEVRCEVVVVAHGAGAGRWSGWLAEKLSPVREQALVLAGQVPSVGGRAGHGYTGFRPWGAGQVAVGGCRWATPHLEVGEVEPVPVPVVQGRLEDFARSRLGLRAAVARRWAWIEDHSCDGLPIVGPFPGAARWLACVGFGGAEWSLGPVAGRMVVEGLVGGGLRTPPMLSTSRFFG